jgi:hypothetical protein
MAGWARGDERGSHPAGVCRQRPSREEVPGTSRNAAAIVGVATLARVGAASAAPRRSVVSSGLLGRPAPGDARRRSHRHRLQKEAPTGCSVAGAEVMRSSVRKQRPSNDWVPGTEAAAHEAADETRVARSHPHKQERARDGRRCPY